MNTSNLGSQCADIAAVGLYETKVDTNFIQGDHHTDQDDKYGLSDAEYQALVDDCQESAEMYTHIHHFLTTDADVTSYLF